MSGYDDSYDFRAWLDKFHPNAGWKEVNDLRAQFREQKLKEYKEKRRDEFETPLPACPTTGSPIIDGKGLTAQELDEKVASVCDEEPELDDGDPLLPSSGHPLAGYRWIDVPTTRWGRVKVWFLKRWYKLTRQSYITGVRWGIECDDPKKEKPHA